MFMKMSAFSTFRLLFAVFFLAFIHHLSISNSASSSLTTSSSSIIHTHTHTYPSHQPSFTLYASAALHDDDDDDEDDDDDLDQFDDDEDELDEIETINLSPSGPKEFKWADTEATTFIWSLINNHDVSSLTALLAKDPDSVKYRSKDGRSALHWAYEYGHNDVVQILKAAGADENAVDADGNKPSDMVDKDEL